MRILTVGSLYPPHHLGGYELVWQAAVAALSGAGHEVTVLCARDRLRGEDVGDDEPAVERVLRWYWRDHAFPRLGFRGRLAIERHNRAQLARAIREHRPEVVSWWSMGGMSLSLIEQVRRAGIPALAWVNDDWLAYGPHVDQWTRMWGSRPALAPLAERAFGVPARLDLDHAARYVFCSETLRDMARAWQPGLADTAVLHQGAAPDFTPAPERPWEGRLLYAGRIDARKGVGTLVDAVAALDAVTLRVLGDGDPELLAALAARAPDRVSFEGAVPRAQLARAYADSDAVVFPVEWPEPWGLVPLEAMAVGRPVIATGEGGSAEYLEAERNAVLYPAGDAPALAAAIERVAADPGLRSRLRAGGLETAARLTEARWTAAVVAEHERATR